MPFFDTLASYLTTPVYAEEPAQPDETEDESKVEAGGDTKESGEEAAEVQDSEEKVEEGGDDAEGGDEGGDGEDAGQDDEEEDDEEDEEEEPEDLMPKFQEECAKLPACAHAKNELEECTERVKVWDEDDRPVKQKGPKEDCVEEFFEYTHCISQCAAPKLFHALA
ncbi:MAG: ubiquinol--cytochrome-c reductase subunit 6 [Chrysothrix sp. TS-e1954]|nr:MAG: ubiquinol--cytochrome-c reductase subunit 6 [Chrysothrix sp. TS-e1954]